MRYRKEKGNMHSRINRVRLLTYGRQVDPEHLTLRAATLTAICCLLSITFFQYLHQTTLLGWAAFAALAYSQIDTLEVPAKRIPYLALNIVVFSALAWVGITLGHYQRWFLLSIPFVIFACGYTIAYGNRYFNPGAWAAFLYVAFGSVLGDRFFAWHVAITFVGVGILCMIVSLLFFPEKPVQRMRKSCIRILERCRIDNGDVELLLNSQNALFQTYLKHHLVAKEQQAAYWECHKVLYQLHLSEKHLKTLKMEAMLHIDFAESQLPKMHEHTQILIQALIDLLRGKIYPFPVSDGVTQECRDAVKAAQAAECQKHDPDLSGILAYSSYLFHTIQIWNLLSSLATPARVIVGIDARDES
ncbi:hypothetical protein EO087_01365 [Dyella sp. M7H15-1]|uniref:hypothetical protein n=1 Tax=Dyella sp. M7H15-1 TaxID=2501295 RepID=UPI001004F086|nr:hypothetical protein [Dyella sp. M7H15-1]QAU22796.1 hypothetical protein EO087_01365 [Dyella sp. M7H15-1]